MEIEFPETGIVLLNGYNRDTKGSSGSGKTTINLALALAFDYCPFPTTSLQSWFDGAPPLKVTVDLSNGVEELSSQRGKKTALWIGGEPFKGSVSQIDEELARRLGSTEIRRALTYRGQRKPGLFLSYTDERKKEFLTQVLELELYERAADRSAAKVVELEGRLARAEESASLVEAMVGAEPAGGDEAAAHLENCRQELGEVRRVRVSKVAALTEAEAAVRLGIASAGDSLLPELSVARDRLAAARLLTAGEPPTELLEAASAAAKLLAECGVRMRRVAAENLKLREEWQRRRGQLEMEIQTLRFAAGEQRRWSDEVVRLSAAIATLEAEACPTCEQPWDRAAEHRLALQSDLVAARVKRDAASAARARADERGEELRNFPAFVDDPMLVRLQELHDRAVSDERAARDKIAGAKAGVAAELRTRVLEADAQVLRLQAAVSAAQAVAREHAEAALAPLRAAVRDLSDGPALAAVATAEARVREVRDEHARWTEARKRADVARVQYIDLAVLATEERDLSAMIGRTGFLGSIFDEALVEISAEVNRVLASVANTRHITFEFRSESVTQKGTVQRRIVPAITVDGHAAEFASGLSGGMQEVVELAVDLAVGAVVARRTGACPGWLLLDECFEGLGPVEKESCIEILQRFAHDRLVIVVDHGSEFKSLFTHTIDVEFSQGRSWIATTANPRAKEPDGPPVRKEERQVRRPRRRVQREGAGGERRGHPEDDGADGAQPAHADGGEGAGPGLQGEA